MTTDYLQETCRPIPDTRNETRPARSPARQPYAARDWNSWSGIASGRGNDPRTRHSVPYRTSHMHGCVAIYARVQMQVDVIQCRVGGLRQDESPGSSSLLIFLGRQVRILIHLPSILILRLTLCRIAGCQGSTVSLRVWNSRIAPDQRQCAACSSNTSRDPLKRLQFRHKAIGLRT